MVVTGRMSFFSDALGHSGFTGIAIGVLCGAASPTWFAVALAVAFALLFSYVKSRTTTRPPRPSSASSPPPPWPWVSSSPR